MMTTRLASRHTDRQTSRHTDRQTSRQTDRKKTGRQTNMQGDNIHSSVTKSMTGLTPDPRVTPEWRGIMTTRLASRHTDRQTSRQTDRHARTQHSLFSDQEHDWTK